MGGKERPKISEEHNLLKFPEVSSPPDLLFQRWGVACFSECGPSEGASGVAPRGRRGSVRWGEDWGLVLWPSDGEVNAMLLEEDSHVS